MDFRSPVLPTAGGPLQPLFPPPGPLAHPPHSQAGMFLYPGLSSPVKPPPLHILPSHKLEHRSTATVPPLLHTPVTATPTANSETTHTSSFAAALKSLARNAGGSDGRDSSSKALEGGTHSPKRPHASRLADQATGGPPVVTIAPTTTRQRQDVSIVAGEPRKSSADAHMRASGALTAASLAPPITSAGDLCKSGFQPYRAVSAADDHRAMMDAAAMYSAAAAAAAGGFPSPASAAAALYSVHPAQHNIYSSRLEEQLYLERLGLLRQSALGMAGAGYPPVSAFPHMLSPAQYPPELMHSPLYMSQSLYLQERLKLEEDARRRLESERDRSRASSRTPISSAPVSGRVRSPMTSQAKSHSPVTSQRSAVKRERSPLTTSAVSTAATTATWAAEQRSPLTPAAPTSGRERSPLRAVAADLRVSPPEQRAEPLVVRENPSVYRPYLPSPSRPCVRDSSRNPLDLSRESPGISPANSNDVMTNGVRRTSSDSSEGFRPPSKKTTVVRPFEDKPHQPNGALRHDLPHAAEQNGPLNLCSVYPSSLPGQERKREIEPAGADTKNVQPTIQFPAVIPPRVEDRRSSTSASATASSAPMDLSGARRSSAISPELTRRVTSRLDRREQRLRQGQEDPESPPVGPLHVLSGPPCKPETSPQKLDFLSHVGLTTPCRKNDVELQKCERHVALHRPVTSPISAHQMTAARRSPADMTSPPAQLTVALNRTPDLVAKRLFLDAIGLTPSGGQPKQAVAAVTASRVGDRVSPSLPLGKAASPPAGASKSSASRRARIIPYSRPSSASTRQTPSSPNTVVAPSVEAMETPVLKLPGPAAWSGPQTITAIYTHYAKERALALEQTRQRGDQLKMQHRELEETSRTLSLRMNAAVATRSQLTRQRDQLQEKMALLVSTLQRLQSPLR